MDHVAIDPVAIDPVAIDPVAVDYVAAVLSTKTASALAEELGMTVDISPSRITRPLSSDITSSLYRARLCMFSRQVKDEPFVKPLLSAAEQLFWVRDPPVSNAANVSSNGLDASIVSQAKASEFLWLNSLFQKQRPSSLAQILAKRPFLPKAQILSILLVHWLPLYLLKP